MRLQWSKLVETGEDARPPSLLVCSSGLLTPKCRDHVLGKHLLRLDTLPVIETAEVRDDRQFADATFLLQCFDLLDDFVRRANEADFLFNDFFVGQFSQRFERAARVKSIPFGAEFRFLLLALDRLDRGGVESEKV